MHRLIMNSATYRQSSSINGQHQKLDPENELLSRMPLHKLDAEALRDSILFVAGQLNEKNRGGKPDGIKSHKDGLVSIPRGPDGWRRSIYVQQRRTEMPTFLTTFDLPRMEPNCIERPQSTVAPQALIFMNNNFVIAQSRVMAVSLQKLAVKDLDRQLATGWEHALGHKPTGAELSRAREFVQKQTALFKERKDKTPELTAMSNYCQALMSANRFVYVD